MDFTKKNILVFLCLFFTLSPFKTGEAKTIEQVKVEVIDLSFGANSLVLERMATSMQAVAEQLIVGKENSFALENQSLYQTVLSDISNRVFAGYDTEKLDIQIGKVTKIAFYVRPWQEVTQDVQVSLYLSGIDPLWAYLIEDKILTLKEDTKDILTGVSIDSIDWVGILAKNYIRETVESALPDFKTNVDIVAGKEVILDIVLIPVGNSVHGVDFDLNSDTMPTLVLLDARSRIAESAGSLRGLPVSFVRDNSFQIREKLSELVEQERIVKKYKLNTDIIIIPKSDTEVTVNLDSDRYRFWIEGYLDISREEDNVSGAVHLGKLISSRDELFLETTLYANDMKWKFDPGIARSWGNTRAAFLYRMPDDRAIFRLEYKFLKDWQLRIEKHAGFGRTEFALRYRIHEFLAAEIVLGKEKENYLRLVGNL